jgi:hypothetical protein
MKLKNTLLLLASILITSVSSCRPVNIPKIETIASNETAFLVPLEGDREAQVKFDSEAFLEKNKISVGRVEIPQRWRDTGRFYLSGEYIPTVSLIKVDRAPITVQWQSSTDKDGKMIRVKDDNSIWIESKDSVGFSVGFNVSAYIEAENASKFLYMYANRPLKDVMNTEIHGRTMEAAQNFASDYPLDELREKKSEMVKFIQTDVTEFFKLRGITVTNLGIFGGFSYENDKIQEAIDGVFIAQQQKNTTKAALEAQNSINEKTISESKALAQATQEKARGAAEGYVIEAKGKADAVALEVKALNDAQSNPIFLEIQKLNVSKMFNQQWDGKLPTSYIGTDKVTTLMGVGDFGTKTK